MATFASLVGLYLFRRWARTLFAAVLLATLGLTLLMGGSFSSSLTGTLDGLLWICDGAILAMVFTDSVRDRFG